MTTMEQGEFIGAGYCISQPSPVPPWKSRRVQQKLLPSRIVSISDCNCVRTFLFPGAWVFQDNRGPHSFKNIARDFGIVISLLEDLDAWHLERSNRGYDFPNLYSSLEVARSAAAKFFPTNSDAMILGVGLHRMFLERFQKAAIYPAPEQGIARNQPLVPSGKEIGFDVTSVNFSYCWLCHSLERFAHKRFGMTPNEYGLIDHFDDAYQVTQAIWNNEFPAEEGILWLPWQLVRYDLFE